LRGMRVEGRMSDQIKSKYGDKLERHLTELSEEFDTVRIFVTRHDGAKGTFAVSRGRGNIYAQYGHVREWLLMMDAGSAAEHERRVGDNENPS